MQNLGHMALYTTLMQEKKSLGRIHDKLAILTLARTKRRELGMMDFLMLAVMAVSAGLIWLLIQWCGKQVDSNE